MTGCAGTGIGALGAVLLAAASVAAAADLTFQHVVVDDAAPDRMWAKTVGDFNGDGRLDLMVAGSGGAFWYESPSWEKHLIHARDRYFHGAFAADIDADGDQDILTGRWYSPGVAYWIENPGDDGEWVLHEVGELQHDAVYADDLDADGDLDILGRSSAVWAGEIGEYVHIWRQEGDPDTWTEFTRYVGEGEHFNVGDVDADGDTDYVVANRWYENPGTIADTWEEHVFTEAWTHLAAYPDVADMNRDGRPDIVLTPTERQGQIYRTAWYEAPADPRSAEWIEHVIEDGIECVTHALQVADMDNDGDLDVVTAEMHQSEDPDEVRVYVNLDGVGGAWQKVVVATTGSHWSRVLDADSDGDLDIFGANHEGIVVDLWLNDTVAGLAAPADLTCGETGPVYRLAWSNPVAYREIGVLLDGVEQAVLPGDTTEYAASGAPGEHRVDVEGRVEGRTRRAGCTVSLAPHAPGALACGTDGLQVTLRWENVGIYDEVLISRDSEVLAALPGDAVGASDAVPEPGVYRYEVAGAAGGVTGAPAVCEAAAPGLPAPLDLTCDIEGETGRLRWSNPVPYVAIAVRRGDTLLAILDGSATSYDDPREGTASRRYTVTGRGDGRDSAPAACIAGATIESLVCTAGEERAALRWTEPLPYDVVTIKRDGAQIAVVPGGTGYYAEDLGDSRTHEYELCGFLDAGAGAAARCAIRSARPDFLRGDVNLDGSVNISDGIGILMFLFGGAGPHPCLEALDANGDGAVTIADAIHLLGHIVGAGNVIPPPYPSCGAAPVPASPLGCERFTACE